MSTVPSTLSQLDHITRGGLTAQPFIREVPTVVLAVTEESVVEADVVVALEHSLGAVAVVEDGGVEGAWQEGREREGKMRNVSANLLPNDA